jgi:glucose/arabinose dehydrogenase
MNKLPVLFSAILLTIAGILLAPQAAFSQPKIQLVNFASGFDLPLDIAHCGDSRLFVVERDGVIWVLDSLGNRLDTFLNIDPRVNSGQNEQGLLGLAFDPDYAQNGYFYVDYTKNSTGNTRVARFSVKPGNPNEADPNSELTILEQTQPNWNHNGGCLKFGPDGYLYISLGDGGGANDPSNYSQNKKNLLGKILRIDVKNSSASQPYQVPSDNPFVGNADYLPEIWSLGWRNPWRFSFDRLTGDMWIGDVGQNLWEEVDFEPAHTPGLNYGWRCYEGTHNFNTSGCQPASNYVNPFFDYSHSAANGCSVTGGFIYRGNKYPDLLGCYLFADYCSGRVWYTKRDANGAFTTNVLANLGAYEFSSFGEDRDGELYVALLSSGKVQKIKELCSAFQISLDYFVGTSCQDGFSGSIGLTSTGATGAVTYKWSNGQTDALNVYLNPGFYNVEVKDGNGCIRRDTFEIVKIGPDIPTLSTNDSIICPNGFETLVVGNLPVPSILSLYNGPNLVANAVGNSSAFIFTVSQPGDYSVVVNDSACIATSSVVQIKLDTLTTPTLSSSGDTLFSSLPCGLCTWFFNGQPIAGASNNYYVATASGNYSLTYTTPNGCQFRSGDLNLVVSNTKLPDSVRRFSLSPNPTENSILLEMDLKNSEKISISLADASQRQVYTQSQSGKKIVLPIDLSNLPNGTYFLTVKLEQGSFVRKVVKK